MEQSAADRADGHSDRADAPALHVEGLSKTFGSGADAVTAVDGVSLTVEPGAVVGLLGPNGAGKTTTIECILGLVLPDAGTVRVDGVDVATNPRAAYREMDAMLEGARNDYWRLTVRENLRYFAAVGGEDPAALRERHDELLDRLDLLDRADTPVRDLSRGMKQKASLASALAGDVSVVFLDEPTLGLDVESSLVLREELGRLAGERDLTVVLSSHDMDVVEDVCDRVVVLHDGRVVADDTVENLLAGFESRGFRLTLGGLAGDAVAALRDRFDVTSVETVGDRTRLAVAADTDGFYRLTDALEAHGATVESVETIAPDLEEAFVEMTGTSSDGTRETGEPTPATDEQPRRTDGRPPEREDGP